MRFRLPSGGTDHEDVLRNQLHILTRELLVGSRPSRFHPPQREGRKPATDDSRLLGGRKTRGTRLRPAARRGRRRDSPASRPYSPVVHGWCVPAGLLTRRGGNRAHRAAVDNERHHQSPCLPGSGWHRVSGGGRVRSGVRDSDSAERPLTLTELIRQFDEGDIEGSGYFGGLSLGYNESNAEWSDRESLRHFTTISSDFYPQLEEHYEKVFEAWVAEEVEEPGDSES